MGFSLWILAIVPWLGVGYFRVVFKIGMPRDRTNSACHSLAKTVQASAGNGTDYLSVSCGIVIIIINYCIYINSNL